MSSRRNSTGIRVCTGLTRAFRGSATPHSTERSARDFTNRSDQWNFSEIPLVHQNSKLTRRNMAG
ncbi:hypothetical protein DF050_27380 [Burkholderia cepacia]|nr:hypothetical protein DF050_27380 [Burkholderia cepacia]